MEVESVSPEFAWSSERVDSGPLNLIVPVKFPMQKSNGRKDFIKVLFIINIHEFHVKESLQGILH
jgi:hypothetical protein